MAFDFNAKDTIGWTLTVTFRYKTDEDRLFSAQQTCRLAAQKSMN